MNSSPVLARPDSSNWLRSRASAIVATILAFVLLASTGLILSRAFERSQMLQLQVQQSYERRAHLRSLLSLFQDIEIGQRGFVVTGDPQFLEPYTRARPQLEAEMAELDEGASSEPNLRSALFELRRLSEAKLRFAESSVGLQRQGRGAESVLLIKSGRGKRAMDAIRGAIARLDGLERKQLETRIAHSGAADARAMQTSAVLQIVLILLLTIAAWVVGKSLEERRRSLRRTEDLAARQAAIFNAAKDGIIVVNASGSIESLNPAAAAMYGYSPAELVRRDVGILFEVAPDQGKVETFLKRLQRRSAANPDSTHEFWGRRRDGSTFPGDVTLSPVQLAGGPRYVAIVRDISERKQVDRMKSEFVSVVSHELRTPLTSIAGSLGLLGGGAAGTLPGPAARLVEIARNNCERLVRLINDILDVEKIESGKMRFDILPVPLAPLLEQTLEANAGFALKHQVRLVLAEVDPSAAAMADRDALSQVLTNLLSNAVKFSPAGKAVRVEVARLDRCWRISVSDRGPGIPEDFRERIFGKFAQADSTDARRIGGSGLGLSIVREIVSRLGGRVGFEDRKGGGTSFHVDLPAASARQADEERGDDGLGRPTILHVDDDPDVLGVVAEAFSGKANVRTAASLDEARQILALQRPDAVLLDAALADGSGLDLVADLEQGSRRPAVIVFSAEEIDPASAHGADAILVKARASLAQLVSTTLDLVAGQHRDAA